MFQLLEVTQSDPCLDLLLSPVQCTVLGDNLFDVCMSSLLPSSLDGDVPTITVGNYSQRQQELTTLLQYVWIQGFSEYNNNLINT